MVRIRKKEITKEREKERKNNERKKKERTNERKEEHILSLQPFYYGDWRTDHCLFSNCIVTKRSDNLRL